MTEIGENCVKSAVFTTKTRNEIRRIHKNVLFRVKKCDYNTLIQSKKCTKVLTIRLEKCSFGICSREKSLKNLKIGRSRGAKRRP